MSDGIFRTSISRRRHAGCGTEKPSLFACSWRGSRRHFSLKMNEFLVIRNDWSDGLSKMTPNDSRARKALDVLNFVSDSVFICRNAWRLSQVVLIRSKVFSPLDTEPRGFDIQEGFFLVYVYWSMYDKLLLTLSNLLLSLYFSETRYDALPWRKRNSMQTKSSKRWSSTEFFAIWCSFGRIRLAPSPPFFFLLSFRS